MLQAFYNAALGAQQQMERLGVHSNNITNVNTYGYKPETPEFHILMYSMVEGIDGEQLPKGSGAIMGHTTTDFDAGPVEFTGKDLDYAIEGNGFFALYEPATGEVTFTRDGAFVVSGFLENGVLVNYLSDGEGRQVLSSDGYPMPVVNTQQDLPIGVFNIQYEDGLLHADSSRFRLGDKNGVITMSDAKVRRGYLETSGTDLAKELSKVIETQRSYSYALKMVTTADEVETTINNLVNG